MASSAWLASHLITCSTTISRRANSSANNCSSTSKCTPVPSRTTKRASLACINPWARQWRCAVTVPTTAGHWSRPISDCPYRRQRHPYLRHLLHKWPTYHQWSSYWNSAELGWPPTTLCSISWPSTAWCSTTRCSSCNSSTGSLGTSTTCTGMCAAISYSSSRSATRAPPPSSPSRRPTVRCSPLPTLRNCLSPSSFRWVGSWPWSSGCRASTPIKLATTPRLPTISLWKKARNLSLIVTRTIFSSCFLISSTSSH